MGLGDNLARDRRPQSSVLTEINKAAARGPEPEPAMPVAPERPDPLPRPGDAYMAHARRTPHPQMTLFLIGRDYLPDGFSYANLERVRLVDSENAGGAPALVLRFSGSVVIEAVIEGRHLHPLCNAIGLHLVQWLWEHPSPNDFASDKDPFIKKITVRQVEN